MESIEVEPLLVGKQFRTEVWISETAALAIQRESGGPQACLKKLATFATGGFLAYEGERGAAIRHETGEAYRIRYKDSSLFRIIGFYTGADKREFIVIDAFMKPAEDGYPAKLWRRIQAVDAVARTPKAWSKKVGK